MKKIQVEGIDLIYFYFNDSLATLNNLNIQIRDLSYYLKPELMDKSDIRLIFIITPWDYNTANVNYLYWLNIKDLKVLDIRIENNIFTEEDFHGSVITRYQKTKCFHCDSSWDTLVIEELNYFRNPGVGLEKIRQSVIKSCPLCQNSLRQLVVYVF